MFDAAGLDVALLCHAFLGTRSSNNDALLVFKLVGAETIARPDTGRFRHPCDPRYFFTHAGR
jgi:hypothetical protein